MLGGLQMLKNICVRDPLKVLLKGEKCSNGARYSELLIV